MGINPFLSGTSFYGFDGCAYRSALGLDKELFQIAPGYRAKNNRRINRAKYGAPQGREMLF